MNEIIKTLLTELNNRMPDIQVLVDPPENADGPVWLDLQWNGKTATIEHRPSTGFGLYLGAEDEPEDAYGVGPTEIYRKLEPLLIRLAKYFESCTSDSIGLRELRELCLLTQEQLGERTGKKQSAISKVESREELRLRTLVEHVESLGGNVRIRANFKDFDVPLTIVRTSESATSKASDTVHWLNRPPSNSLPQLSMAARSVPRDRQQPQSKPIEVSWTAGSRAFRLFEHNSALVLTLTTEDPLAPDFQWLSWFDRRYELTPSKSDAFTWNVAMSLSGARLLWARMTYEVDDKGEGQVLPWVT